MLNFFRRKTQVSRVARLVAVLADESAESPAEVFRRCQALDALAELRSEATQALPVIHRAFTVPVGVDCVLVLRVAAAAAAWRVGGECNLAVPVLAWALKDEYWGVAPRAAEILSEIGHAGVVPDLIRLAERRLAHGPFHFEAFASAAGGSAGRPLLAVVAEAIGWCGSGRWDGPSYESEARAILATLATNEDRRVRDAAAAALARLGSG